MTSLILALALIASPGGEPLDGFERFEIVAKAKQTAAAHREAPDDVRREAVARAIVADHLIVGAERRWLREVLEWSCRPYDGAGPVPVPSPTPVVPLYYQIIPQAYYRGGCATGTCPR